MNFNNHSNLVGQHAFLGASRYHWVNYDNDKLILSYNNWQAAQKGTELHAIAATLINNGIKLPRTKKTFNMYVNDGIGYRMKTEQILYYSDNCFGTADSIMFKDNFLRIHDLKNGITPTDILQLQIYEALFCLEYSVRPGDIHSELRIYQNDDVIVNEPTVEEISYIIDKIIVFNKLIDNIKTGG